MQKGFINTSAVSTAPTATYAVQQRPGTVLAQRGASGSGTPHQLIIYTQRNDQQAYNSQGQPPNTYTIIQTQPPGGGEQSRAVYPPRSMVNANRQEIQRQYVQTAPNGPATSTSAAGGQQQSGGQPPVVHIQLLPHPGAPSGSQQQLVEKRINHVSNHPGSHPHPGGHPQIISSHLQHGGPSDQVVVAERRAGPSALHHPASRPRAKRAHPAAPPAPPPMKQEELFDEMAMHPSHAPVPDAFSHILDQLHSSGETPKEFYRKLKKQFKYLVYENECYQEELRNSQRHLLKLSRDKNFLLDRLSTFEAIEEPSEDEDSDVDSDATVEEKPKAKKKKPQQPRKRTNTSTSAKKAAAAAKETIKLDEENSQASTEAATPNSPSAKSMETTTAVSEPPARSSPVVDAEIKAEMET